MSTSRSPQSTSSRNCLITPFFIGPRQIIGASSACSMNPIETTARLSIPGTGTGWMASPSDRSFSPTSPSMVGVLGPWMSTSRSPTFFPSRASAAARFTATVLFPTPPFPDMTTYFFFTLSIVTASIDIDSPIWCSRHRLLTRRRVFAHIPECSIPEFVPRLRSGPREWFPERESSFLSTTR